MGRAATSPQERMHRHRSHRTRRIAHWHRPSSALSLQLMALTVLGTVMIPASWAARQLSSESGSSPILSPAPAPFPVSSPNITSLGAHSREASVQQAPLDPCASLAASLESSPGRLLLDGTEQRYVPPSAWRQCRKSSPFNPQVQLHDLDALEDFMRAFYPFQHIAKSSPDPDMPAQYDVLAELEKLRTQAFYSSEDFYDALMVAVRGLNDAHTGVFRTDDLDTHFVLPLSFVGVQKEDGRPGIYVAPAELQSTILDLAADFATPLTDARALFGAEVLSINGEPAWQHVQDWAAREAGGFPNPGQRVNSALARGNWDLSPGQGTRRSFIRGKFSFRALDPGADAITLQLVRPARAQLEQVQVPWMTQVNYTAWQAAAIQSVQTFQRHQSQSRRHTGPGRGVANTRPGERGLRGSMGAGRGMGNIHPRERGLRGMSAGSRRSQPRVEMGLAGRGRGLAAGLGASSSPQQQQQEQRRQGPRERRLQENGLSAAQELSDPADWFRVFLLDDMQTAVVIIPTFSVANVQGIERFITEASRAFRLIKRRNLPQVIIDLTDNNGGAVRLGNWMVQLLVGTRFFRDNNLVRQTDHIRLLAESGFLFALLEKGYHPVNWTEYVTTSEEPFGSKEEFAALFVPPETLSFGAEGEPGQYSRMFMSPVPPLEMFFEGVSEPALGANTRMMLLSNGLCYSTCHMFATNMGRRFGVPLVTVGGIPSQPLAFAAGGGAAFVAQDSILEAPWMRDPELRQRDDAPRDFLGPIDMSMAIGLGFFNKTDPIPIEYTFLGDGNIPYTMGNVADPSKIWTEAAEYFKGRAGEVLKTTAGSTNSSVVVGVTGLPKGGDMWHVARPWHLLAAWVTTILLARFRGV